MTLKTRDLVIAAACGVAVGLPALAYGRDDPPSTATVTAVDTGYGLTDHAWSGGTLTIVKGGTVTFRNPGGTVYQTGHSVTFTADQPTRCSSVPDVYGPPGWQGSCDFESTGTYPFICPIHPDSMKGRITVVAPSPSATPTPTATPGASPTPTPGPDGSGQPVTQTTLTGLVVVPKSQTGTRVRGSVMVKLADSRLEVTLWAPRKALQGGRSTTPVRIGRVTRASAPAGKLSFAVQADAKARGALRRHRRLSVTVSIALTPPGGHKLTHSARSTLRAG